MFNTNLNLQAAPAPLHEIHEVEFTSRCNLACKYCPHPKMTRPKADMTEETFRRVLAHIKHLCDAGTQGEVSMTGIGEAIMHPKFVEWMHRLRWAIGTRRLVLATNGVAMTQDLAFEMKHAGCIVYVSTHRPEKAGPAVDMLRDVGCAVGTNTAFVDSAIDWAGQVPWRVSAKSRECEYLRAGWGAVRQDGSVNTCCMDAESLHVIGHVDQEPGTLTTRATALCESCHQIVPQKFRIGGAWPRSLLDAQAKLQEAQVNNGVNGNQAAHAAAVA